MEEVTTLHSRFRSLTPREREIMMHVTAGLMNKQIAAEIGLSEITVKIHRGNVMKKMEARSLADLVRMAEALHISRPSDNATNLRMIYLAVVESAYCCCAVVRVAPPVISNLRISRCQAHQ